MNDKSAKKRTWRLAGTYLAVMMTFSVIFSGAIFAVFSQNINRPAPMHFRYENNQDFKDFQGDIAERDQAALNSIIFSLVILNLLILGLGAWASYLLARWTLRPIEQNMELQAQFVSDASHEIRTPLAAMLVSNEIALRKKILTEEKSRAVFKKNIEEIEKLSSLAENLLNLSNSKKSIAKKTKIAAREFNQILAEKIKPLALSKNISVKNYSQDFEIEANLSAIEQILTIFSENAIKYSPENSNIEINFSKDKKRAVFEIRDYGEGISRVDQQKIFERFYRSDSARTRGENSGYGLGLAIAKSLAEKNDFEIKLESELGEGSKFKLIV